MTDIVGVDGLTVADAVKYLHEDGHHNAADLMQQLQERVALLEAVERAGAAYIKICERPLVGRSGVVDVDRAKAYAELRDALAALAATKP